MLKAAIAALAALAVSASAFAQTTTTTTLTPAAQQVQLVAPQLVPFSGSSANFDSLVNGLTSGAPVTLTTANPDGSAQIVTFLPGPSLTVGDAARRLETARQNLIASGIATPTAQQVAVALMGGPLTALSGTATLTGVLSGTTGTTQIQVRNDPLPLPTPAGAGELNLSAANLQALRTALGQGSAVTLSSTTTTGITQGVTFTVPGGPMNAADVNQALQLAAALLGQQGIPNPTPDQVRVALVGGTLAGLNGTNVVVQGVLQGRLRTTSASPLVNTSNSPLTTSTSTSPLTTNTSNSPLTTNTSNSPLTSTSTSTATGTSASPLTGTSTSTLTGTSASPLTGTSTSTLTGTSTSPLTSTSNSPPAGTSASPLTGTSNTPAAVVPSANPAPVGAPVNGERRVSRPRG